MAHYSSQHNCYEDGDKLSLKSTPVKPLVFASFAQKGVNAGDESYGQVVMAYDFRPIICGDLILLLAYTNYSDGLVMG